eukprot:2334441-Amphidinium_carterae.1
MSHPPSGTPLPHLILNPGGALPQNPHPRGAFGSTGYESQPQDPGASQALMMLPPSLPSSRRHNPYGPAGRAPVTPAVVALG